VLFESGVDNLDIEARRLATVWRPLTIDNEQFCSFCAKLRLRKHRRKPWRNGPAERGLTPAGLSIEAPIAQLSSLIARGNIDKAVFESGGASPNNCKGGTHGYHLANGTRPQTNTITPQHG
jgi:hypothetical protein